MKEHWRAVVEITETQGVPAFIVNDRYLIKTDSTTLSGAFNKWVAHIIDALNSGDKNGRYTKQVAGVENFTIAGFSRLATYALVVDGKRVGGIVDEPDSALFFPGFHGNGSVREMRLYPLRHVLYCVWRVNCRN